MRVFPEGWSGKFELIYADPPWKYRDQARAGQRGAEFKYPCMDLDEICNLPVASIAAEDCLLALWWTPPMPREALAVVDAWGFRLCNMKGFTWIKLTKNGKIAFGMGHKTRGNSEDCLFAVRGKPKIVDHSLSQVVFEERRGHSRKPDEARRKLESLLGEVNRIELFARESHKGWKSWGLETDIVPF